MRYNCIVVLFYVLLSPLFGGEEIRVHLNTESPLAPLYVGRLEENGGGYQRTYLRRLQEVLEFDLKYSGYFNLVRAHHDKETFLWQVPTRAAFNPKKWKDWGIAHVVRAHVVHNKLQLFLLDVQKQSLKQFADIPISGELGKDRKLIHHLCDSIVKTLFGKEGVASSRLLFSLQIKKSLPGQNKWFAEIWECDWDGANSRPVTCDKSYNVSPVFVPAQKSNDHFLYVSYHLSQPKVYLGSVSGKKRIRFLTLKGNQLLPTLSPERDMVAFISDAAGRPDLFVQKLNRNGTEEGKPIQLFSYPHSTQASPTFSPDGKQLAFVSDKDGAPRIYLIDARRAAKRPPAKLLTKRNPESSCPNWSSDGRKIAYSAKTNGVRQIWIYDFDKEEEKQLTFGPGNKENPTWAPDSLHLVFNSTDNDSSELYIVNLNQPDAVKITSGPGKKHYPCWGKR